MQNVNTWVQKYYDKFHYTYIDLKLVEDHIKSLFKIAKIYDWLYTKHYQFLSKILKLEYKNIQMNYIIGYRLGSRKDVNIN